jgi:predicted ATPase/class 3 adenylate cyclase
MQRQLPSGTVTFVFTDIEGSTRLLHELGSQGYANALAEHRRVLRDAFASHGGVEVDTQGDAFFLAFDSADEAIAAARTVQQALRDGPIRIRVGIHTGQPILSTDGYVGIDVHRAARICAAAHGGQVVISAPTRSALLDAALDQVVDLGLHRLKDLTTPERLYQVGDGQFPPLRSLNATNLPLQPNELIGRDTEVAEVVQLARDGIRVVTLTGPGGTGKTRLGLQAAAELVPDYPDGVFWVPLAPLRDPRLVITAAEQALGAKVSLADHIDERRMLLLFDNFEQVTDAATDLARVLAACPNLKVLATSRAPLRIAGEREYPVEPLPESEAVELFRQRATTTEPIEAVHEICRRLDGLPLAIELAAARTRLLPPDRLLERLDRSLAVLSGGQRDAPERQQTLRATIEWSQDLLDDDERELFARLAVFRGGFTVEAAESVCDAGLDGLESLVEKSLLRRSAAGRLGMLETIHEFADERLGALPDAEVIKRRHAEYFLALADAAQLSEIGPAEGGSMDLKAVQAEIENIRAALEWATESDTELGVRLVVALAQYWISTAPSEGQRWLESLLDRKPDLPSALKASALRSLGGVVYIQGDFAEGHRLHQESLDEFRRVGDEAQVGLTLVRLAIEAQRTGDNKRAKEIAEEALDICRRHSNRRCEAEAVYALGDVAWADGRHDEAVELMEKSAALASEVGFTWWRTGALEHLSEFALELNRRDDVRKYIADGLPLASSMNDRMTTVWFLGYAAWLAALDGLAERAGRLWGAIEAEERRGRIGQWELQRADYLAKLERVYGTDFEQGRAEGQLLTLDDAVAAALSGL